MKKEKCYHETSLGFCPFKKPILPKAKITKSEQGEIKITVSKKVKPGIYELVLEDKNGKEMVITKIEVV